MDYCHKCKNFSVQKTPDKYALNTWSRKDGEIILNAGNFLPLEGFVCSSCGEITFKVDKELLSKFDMGSS